jgi:hypothetical protein
MNPFKWLNNLINPKYPRGIRKLCEETHEEAKQLCIKYGLPHTDEKPKVKVKKGTKLFAPYWAFLSGGEYVLGRGERGRVFAAHTPGNKKDVKREVLVHEMLHHHTGTKGHDPRLRRAGLLAWK